MLVTNKYIKWSCFLITLLILVVVLYKIQAAPLNSAGNKQKFNSTKLKELIINDIPRFNEYSDEYEKVNLLRRWSYTNTDWSSKDALIDRDKSFNFYKKDASEIFSMFFEDKGGVMCGGTAYSLRKLYEIYGFKASTIDMGKPGVMTHVVTLVKIKYKERTMTVIQDATFDITYVHKNGTPYDYFELLSVLNRHGHEKIMVLHGNSDRRDFLLHPKDVITKYGHMVAANARASEVLDNGLKKYRIDVSLQNFKHNFGKKIGDFLVKEGHPDHLLYLFLYPISSNRRSIVEKAKLIVHSKG